MDTIASTYNRKYSVLLLCQPFRANHPQRIRFFAKFVRSIYEESIGFGTKIRASCFIISFTIRMEILCPPFVPCRYLPHRAFNYTSTFSSSECIWKIAAASDNLIKVMGIIRGLP